MGITYQVSGCLCGTEMKIFLGVACLVLGASAKVVFGPIADANHHNSGQDDTCDPDLGWLPGADGGKCYMLVKGFDYSTCYSNDQFGGYGMDWFDAMQCCYYQGGHLAEPQNEAETEKINTYLTISNGGDKQNSWWFGGTDLHHEGGWVWMSGAPWNYENWEEGEPNQNGNEDCTAFDSQAGYTWMDLECNSTNHGVPHYAVCEKLIA